MMRQNKQPPSLRALKYFGRSNLCLLRMDCRVANAPRNDEAGNVLIFILIAIALLGLLTVTLSRSGDSSNDTGSFEQNQIAASEILNYAKSIENAVQQLLARGCGENEISFENSNVAGYTNPNSPADKSCHVFDVAGAGMTYIAPNEDWLDKALNARPYYEQIVFFTNCVSGIGENSGVTNCNTPNSSNKSTDLLFGIPYIKKSICETINRITLEVSTIPVDQYNYIKSSSIFTGSFFQDSPAINYTAPYLSLEGNTSGCLTGDAAPNIVAPNEYGFFHVLHAR